MTPVWLRLVGDRPERHPPEPDRPDDTVQAKPNSFDQLAWQGSRLTDRTEGSSLDLNSNFKNMGGFLEFEFIVLHHSKFVVKGI
jgi:hypothetical protein